MQLTKRRGSRHMLAQELKIVPKAPEVGLVLLDMALKPILCDRGAALILNGQGAATIRPEPLPALPQEVLDLIGERKGEDLSSAKMILSVGSSHYCCRTYVMEPENGFPAMIALHLERISSLNDAISAVAAKYHLTAREQEALVGISMGLSSKELAKRMNISPNTVKVFLRLIMIKMGVMTRGGIVAQILQSQATTPDDVESRSFSARV